MHFPAAALPFSTLSQHLLELLFQVGLITKGQQHACTDNRAQGGWVCALSRSAAAPGLDGAPPSGGSHGGPICCPHGLHATTFWSWPGREGSSDEAERMLRERALLKARLLLADILRLLLADILMHGQEC